VSESTILCFSVFVAKTRRPQKHQSTKAIPVSSIAFI
jgi:hypothetical protein